MIRLQGVKTELGAGRFGKDAEMIRKILSAIFLILTTTLTSCSPPSLTSREPTSAEVSVPDPRLISDKTISPTNTPVPSPKPLDPAAYPLAERGQYWTGNRSYTLVDPGRSGREIRITIHYPALKEYNAENNPITRDAAPDLSGAPYPLILTGPNSGDLLLKSHLASQGFVMVIVRPPGFHYDDIWGEIVIDGPLDFLFALDQLTASPPEGLTGLIDTDRVGVAGYSWDGFFSLALGGAQIDPENYLSQCAQASSLDPPLSPAMQDYYCSLAADWDQFSAYVGDLIPAGPDGLWEPLTDERILAVMPMAPDGAWLYGQRGLAGVQIPTLIITGTEDSISSYVMETAYIYEHLGSSERYLISFIGWGHALVFNADQALRLQHFASAFFGYYLQGREEYQDHFSEGFINQFDDLAWGVYGE